MKIVRNNCFGGFGLSPLAVQAIAKRKGKECYFFNFPLRTQGEERKKLTVEEAEKEILWSAYSVPDPDFKKMTTADPDGLYKTANAYSDSIRIEFGDRDERNDPDLVAVVEELGDKANGRYAELVVVEIPEGINWYIDDYDGSETVREAHRSW